MARDQDNDYYGLYIANRIDAEKELFLTEITSLRQLCIVKEKFLDPLKGILTSEDLAIFEYVNEFIDFRARMLEELHPKGKK